MKTAVSLDTLESASELPPGIPHVHAEILRIVCNEELDHDPAKTENDFRNTAVVSRFTLRAALELVQGNAIQARAHSEHAKKLTGFIQPSLDEQSRSQLRLQQIYYGLGTSALEFYDMIPTFKDSVYEELKVARQGVIDANNFDERIVWFGYTNELTSIALFNLGNPHGIMIPSPTHHDCYAKNITKHYDAIYARVVDVPGEDVGLIQSGKVQLKTSRSTKIYDDTISVVEVGDILDQRQIDRAPTANVLLRMAQGTDTTHPRDRELIHERAQSLTCAILAT